MYGYIYKTTNKITGKIYIGQKKSNKFLKEQYLGSGKILKSKIKHYGEDNFTVELIDTADSKDELNDKEIYWIAKFNSTNPDIGYNISIGGEVPSGIPAWNKGLTKEIDNRLIVSEATKLRHSQSLKRAYAEGRRTYQFTDDVKQKMSEKAKCREHKPTTAGRIYFTDGVHNKCVPIDQAHIYEELGWNRGRTISATPWNKGLTKETDERVAKYADKRNEHFRNGESIGFCGVKNNRFPAHESMSEYKERINKTV